MGGELLELYRSGLLPVPFGVVDLELARSRATAPGLWAELREAPFADQRRRLAEEASYRSWGLCELLCRESKRAAPESARRVHGELRQAEAAFVTAKALWERGEAVAGEVLGYGAVILDLEASLRGAQRRFPEALALLDRVIAFYQEGPAEFLDAHLAGRAMVSKGGILWNLDRTEEAIALLEAARDLVDGAKEPRVFLCLTHNLLSSLAASGRFQELSNSGMRSAARVLKAVGRSTRCD